MECCKDNAVVLREYDPRPKNTDGSIRTFLYRWDDGKDGVRRLMKCLVCGRLYLSQVYRLNKFSVNAQVEYEDRYAVESIEQADYLNGIYTGAELERVRIAAYSFADGQSVE